jgi:hypothetical protein
VIDPHKPQAFLFDGAPFLVLTSIANTAERLEPTKIFFVNALCRQHLNWKCAGSGNEAGMCGLVKRWEFFVFWFGMGSGIGQVIKGNGIFQQSPIFCTPALPSIPDLP